MIHRSASSLSLTSLLLAALSPAATEAEEDGKRLYKVHCLACHGAAGHGDGPMRDQLELSIPDLTTLAERNDGVFPVEEVQQIIDGRQPSPTHGTREMPVWGFTFQSTGRDTDQEGEVQEMVTALARFLESLQACPNVESEADDPRD